MIRNIDDAWFNLQLIIHAAAIEEDTTIGEQEEMGVERQAGEVGQELMQLPFIGCCRVDLDRFVVRLVKGFRQAGGCENASIAEPDQRWVPTAMNHLCDKGPLLSLRIKHGRIRAASKRIVAEGSSSREQATVGQERVPAAEKIKRTAVGGEDRIGMKEIVRQRRFGIPDHAGENFLRHVAEVRTCKSYSTAARTSEEKHLALRQ